MKLIILPIKSSVQSQEMQSFLKLSLGNSYNITADDLTFISLKQHNALSHSPLGQKSEISSGRLSQFHGSESHKAEMEVLAVGASFWRLQKRLYFQANSGSWQNSVHRAIELGSLFQPGASCTQPLRAGIPCCFAPSIFQPAMAHLVLPTLESSDFPFCHTISASRQGKFLVSKGLWDQIVHTQINQVNLPTLRAIILIISEKSLSPCRLIYPQVPRIRAWIFLEGESILPTTRGLDLITSS